MQLEMLYLSNESLQNLQSSILYEICTIDLLQLLVHCVYPKIDTDSFKLFI